MIITKNDRGGHVLDGADELTLSKKNDWLENYGLDNSDFKNFDVYLNCSKRKLKTLIAVIKFLYS